MDVSGFDNASFSFRLERLMAIPIEIKMIAATIMTAASTTYNGVGDGEDPFGVGDGEDPFGVVEVVIAKVAVNEPSAETALNW
jgi:hypothetical protein